MLLIVNAAVLFLVSGPVWALPVLPLSWFPQLTLVGLRLTVGAGVTPVPLNARFCGLSEALSVKVRLALRLPVAEGVKVTLTVQDALMANVLGLAGQVLLVSAKSLAFVPLIAILVMFKAAWPLLASVTVCALLVVFTFWLPKLKLLGLRFTTGADWISPL